MSGITGVLIYSCCYAGFGGHSVGGAFYRRCDDGLGMGDTADTVVYCDPCSVINGIQAYHA